MYISTIIPTIGRPTLARAVHSILAQDLEDGDFEIIVVNDSGNPLIDEDWMESPRVKILHTNRRNRSIARNTGAAVALGKYLHFLDDDDWILPGVFQQLWNQANFADQAGWIYGSFRLVDINGERVADIQPHQLGNCFVQMIASEWIPLQASLIDSKAFFRIGGFASLDSLGGGCEDIDLSRMIARYYDFTYISEIAAVIRYGDIGSTTEYNNLANQNRRSREKNIETDGALNKMRASARADSSRPHYWQGQIIYYLIASFLWNIRQRKFLSTAHRLMITMLAVAISTPYMFSLDYWRGCFFPHHNLVRITLGDLSNKLYSQTNWER